MSDNLITPIGNISKYRFDKLAQGISVCTTITKHVAFNDDVPLYGPAAIAAMAAALRHAEAWIAAAPHGENCFLADSGEYAACFCGKDGVEEAISSALEDAPDPVIVAASPVAYRMESRPMSYAYMDAKQWVGNRGMYTGHRVHELVLGRLVHEPDMDEDVLHLFPSLIENKLQAERPDLYVDHPAQIATLTDKKISQIWFESALFPADSYRWIFFARNLIDAARGQS